MPKYIVGDRVLLALYDAGVIGDDYPFIRRIVIDLEVGSVAKLYVERFADDDKLIAGLVGGIKIVETTEEAGKTTGRTLPKPGEAA